MATGATDLQPERDDASPNHRDNGGQTAASMAMGVPLIVNNIFHMIQTWTKVHHLIHKKNPTFANCMRVNSLWYAEALPFLWRDCNAYPDCTLEPDLPERLTCISPPRRQFYANIVQTATIKHLPRGHWVEVSRSRQRNKRVPNRKPTHHESVGGLRFSRLRKLTYELSKDDPFLAPIDGRAVEDLTISGAYRSDFEPYALKRDAVKSILDQVGKMFPNVVNLKLLVCGVVPPASMQRLTKRLRCLEDLDCDLTVTENDLDEDAFDDEIWAECEEYEEDWDRTGDRDVTDEEQEGNEALRHFSRMPQIHGTQSPSGDVFGKGRKGIVPCIAESTP